MSPFRFRFQKLLDLKGKQERMLEVEVACLDNVILGKRTELEAWQQERRATLGQLRLARDCGDLQANACGADYLRYLARRADRCRAAVADLRRERERVRQRLQAVVQSRKALENYRDRKRTEFLALEERAEERVLEEHAVRGFLRAERAS